jgi:hypothetical protein
MKQPDSTAKHEIGHALVQALYSIGPQFVTIRQVNGLWEGQSLPDQTANQNKNYARMWVSQIAGPIAQICSAPESLGEVGEQFSSSLLETALAFGEAEQNNLDELGWSSDLIQSHILWHARTVKGVKNNPKFYADGGFLYEAEKVLFRAFRDKDLQCELANLALVLIRCGTIEGGFFLQQAKHALALPVWNALRQLDMDFELPFTIKN